MDKPDINDLIAKRDNRLHNIRGGRISKEDIDADFKFALFQRLASEAVGVKVLSNDAEFEFDDAITISKLKELLGVAE